MSLSDLHVPSEMAALSKSLQVLLNVLLMAFTSFWLIQQFLSIFPVLNYKLLEVTYLYLCTVPRTVALHGEGCQPMVGFQQSFVIRNGQQKNNVLISKPKTSQEAMKNVDYNNYYLKTLSS